MEENMSRVKIDYGIDLGTTNSAISRIEQGDVVIKKSLDMQKDITASAVAFNRKGNMMVGDTGYAAYRSDSIRHLKTNAPSNSFVEFKRTMGTDKKYYSSFMDHSFSSEELSAEVLKRLKEYIQDEIVQSAVITIPAAFKNNQIDATRKAAELAGITYVEMLQEPIAAAMAYGVSQVKQDGFWLVFDFGGGTFDAALLKVEEGILQVIDTEGDNYLGGKNLDFAIVDSILIPHIQENFSIDSIVNDDMQFAAFRNALKFYAETIKNNLSLNPSYSLYVDPGDCGTDDDGEEIEIDLTITQEALKVVVTPIYQKAIDCCQMLLKRKNLQGSSLNSLILVGGPTLSPIVRDMLEAQVAKPDTSMDPMTAVSRGAALYASTIDLPVDIIDQSRNKAKIQLEITSSSSTVEDSEFVAIKTLPGKTEGVIPEQLYVELFRNDNAWSSAKVMINAVGELSEVLLALDKTNVFTLKLTDNFGNQYDCEPSTFSIIQGTVVGSATLPYNIGIEVQDIETGKAIFRSVKGLEKNKSLPATGIINSLKTPYELRAGMKSDFIEISVYQGEHDADRTRAVYNHHVSTIKITGAELPSLLPKDSDVDIHLNVDRSQKITGTAYFPYLDFEYSFTYETEIDSVSEEWLEREFMKAESSLNDLQYSQSGSNTREVKELEASIQEQKNEWNKNKSDTDAKQKAISNLRKDLKKIDQLEGDKEWPDLESDIKRAFNDLEILNKEKGNEQTTKLVDNLRSSLNQVLQEKDIKSANRFLEEIKSLTFELEKLEHLIGFIFALDREFDDIPWKNIDHARRAINRAKDVIYDKPTVTALIPIFVELFENGQFDEQSNIGSVKAMSNLLKG